MQSIMARAGNKRATLIVINEEGRQGKGGRGPGRRERREKERRRRRRNEFEGRNVETFVEIIG